MINYKEINSDKDVGSLFDSQGNDLKIIFKHSTRCPISSEAWSNFQDWVEAENADQSAEISRVLVVENRPLSMQIAEKSAVKHQSPQVIFLSNGKEIWNASHYDINERELRRAMSSIR